MPVSAGKSILYEINTPVWLQGLSLDYGRPITLANVPAAAVDALALPGVTMVWMMGVWERSAFGRSSALKYKHEYHAALPDLTDDDVIGSAYSIGRYTAAEAFGGREGLASFRRQLQARGLRLMLDYVPNHVGIDHPWVDTPGFIVRGKAEDAINRPSDFFAHHSGKVRPVVLAHGRDPYFPGWSDTAQLNIFNAKLRAEIKLTLAEIAGQCDGLRCDMAMLLLNDIFAVTWHGYIKEKPRKEFWAEVIPTVKALYPDFTFLAEVYWGKEADLLALGFDYVYDKVFYDRLITGDAVGLRQHLIAPAEYQRHTMRFIENHDEPRAFTALGPQRSYPAAAVLL
ncbi:MAG TPA: alpha-amylase family glycosyl hydrolase, partial [Candidatus Limnocylindrales bacterium]|nr:alpha-amylase family glycosyl hydrolase [Candidatus Limnocylindrales bacterium]